MDEYRYFKLTDDFQKNGLKTINEMLENGWIPVRECPFGSGYSTSGHILIWLKRTIKRSDVEVTELQNDEQTWQEPSQQNEPSDLHC